MKILLSKGSVAMESLGLLAADTLIALPLRRCTASVVAIVIVPGRPAKDCMDPLADSMRPWLSINWMIAGTVLPPRVMAPACPPPNVEVEIRPPLSKLIWSAPICRLPASPPISVVSLVCANIPVPGNWFLPSIRMDVA